MSSIIKVNTYQDANGNALFSSDGSGNVTGNNLLTPAFEAYLSSAQTVTANTNVKAQIDTKVFDTDNCYDNTTNYRFTPTVAGKYFIYGAVYSDESLQTNMAYVATYIYKNGTRIGASVIDFRANYGGYTTSPHWSGVTEMNGSTDYIELYGRCQTVGGTPYFNGAAGEQRTHFGAYKIIGA